MCNRLLLSCTLSFMGMLLGQWHMGEICTYQVSEDKDTLHVSKEVSNISQTITFLYNQKGVIEYGDGKRIWFEWRNVSDSIIYTISCEDNAESKLFKVQKTNDSLELWFTKSNGITTKYVMRKFDYTIEEYSGKEVKITKYEYDFLEGSNPFPDLTCFITEGCEKDKQTLQVGGQEYLELIHMRPNSQCVMFVKSSKYQSNIPCYLITISRNGATMYANYIRHVEIK